MEEIFFEEKKKKVSEKKEISRVQEKEDKANKGAEEKKLKKENKKEEEEVELQVKNNNEEPQNKIRIDRAYEKNIEFDMGLNKKEIKLKEEDKYEMELMRRWSVKIYNIYITPKMDKLDPFLQFTIGGDFQVEVYSTKKGKTFKVPKGKRGYVDKTDVIENAEVDVRNPFDKVIDVEMRMTYSMITKQKLMVELWDYNSIWMNNIKAYATKPIIEIVNGDCNLEFELYVKKKHYATVEFKFLFQEIWDWKMSFINWSVSSLLPPKDKDKIDISETNKGETTKPEKQLKTRMSIELVKKECNPVYAIAFSEESKEE